MSRPTARQDWDQAIGQMMPNFFTRLARNVIAEQDAEIARLRSELDGYQGRTVLHCMERDMDSACMASLDEPDGTILRATDTARELVLTDHTWLPR